MINVFYGITRDVLTHDLENDLSKRVALVLLEFTVADPGGGGLGGLH